MEASKSSSSLVLMEVVCLIMRVVCLSAFCCLLSALLILRLHMLLFVLFLSISAKFREKIELRVSWVEVKDGSDRVGAGGTDENKGYVLI